MRNTFKTIALLSLLMGVLIGCAMNVAYPPTPGEVYGRLGSASAPAPTFLELKSKSLLDGTGPEDDLTRQGAKLYGASTDIRGAMVRWDANQGVHTVLDPNYVSTATCLNTEFGETDGVNSTAKPIFDPQPFFTPQMIPVEIPFLDPEIGYVDYLAFTEIKWFAFYLNDQRIYTDKGGHPHENILFIVVVPSKNLDEAKTYYSTANVPCPLVYITDIVDNAGTPLTSLDIPWDKEGVNYTYYFDFDETQWDPSAPVHAFKSTAFSPAPETVYDSTSGKLLRYNKDGALVVADAGHPAVLTSTILKVVRTQN